jgi:hypothetical protein
MFRTIPAEQVLQKDLAPTFGKQASRKDAKRKPLRLNNRHGFISKKKETASLPKGRMLFLHQLLDLCFFSFAFTH